MTSTQATILACVIVVCASVLVALGKLHLSEQALNTLAAAGTSFLIGLVTKRPAVVDKALGIPPKSADIPITYKDGDP